MSLNKRIQGWSCLDQSVADLMLSLFGKQIGSLESSTEQHIMFSFQHLMLPKFSHLTAYDVTDFFNRYPNPYQEAMTSWWEKLETLVIEKC